MRCRAGFQSCATASSPMPESPRAVGFPTDCDAHCGGMRMKQCMVLGGLVRLRTALQAPVAGQGRTCERRVAETCAPKLHLRSAAPAHNMRNQSGIDHRNPFKAPTHRPTTRGIVNPHAHGQSENGPAQAVPVGVLPDVADGDRFPGQGRSGPAETAQRTIQNSRPRWPNPSGPREPTSARGRSPPWADIRGRDTSGGCAPGPKGDFSPSRDVVLGVVLIPGCIRRPFTVVPAKRY